MRNQQRWVYHRGEGLRTFGVEEELLLVDPDTGLPQPLSGTVTEIAAWHAGAGPRHAEAPEPAKPELYAEQLEIGTLPCTTTAQLADQLRRARLAAAAAAEEAGVAVAALATAPMDFGPLLTPDERYRRIHDRYAHLVDEEFACACHVHVHLASAEEGVGVLDRIRPWLAPLLALSANSPYFQGVDTGYASWRHQLWQRWPMSGPSELYGDVETYERTTREMLASDVLIDDHMVYFDARLSRRYPTVEIRVGDVCLDLEDTVLLAVLSRALVETAAREWRQGRLPDPVSTVVLRLAAWRASRYGLGGELLDPRSWRPRPADEVLHALLDHVRPALEAAGDRERAEAGVARLLVRGTGADLQRAARAGDPTLASVIVEAVRRTTPA
ncbi:glutamate--cysteine ligase [Streptomyces roseolus]|uniref:glutamate--cysteine ligase n=1 Tax=Streptomyces roseolus TaxID=67358 RepID=UPI00167349F4|nr:glutamate--cysteine ligase [Streptomyces roseolus]GGR33473.1 putative glutamate--cysteine ligase 2 [Streptomyces roseolus]